MRKLVISLFIAFALLPLCFSQSAAFDVGIKVGAKIPSFTLSDQRGELQDFASLKKANGLVLLFFRSADW